MRTREEWRSSPGVPPGSGALHAAACGVMLRATAGQYPARTPDSQTLYLCSGEASVLCMSPDELSGRERSHTDGAGGGAQAHWGGGWLTACGYDC